jgi:hypothetical protein
VVKHLPARSRGSVRKVKLDNVHRKSLIVTTILVSAVIGSAAPALAGVQLVTNGDFENGQLDSTTTATGWFMDPSMSPGYTFLFNPQANTISGTSADNAGATGEYGSLSLWGPGNGSANGLTLSPTGGAFVALDSAFQQDALDQTINGLTAGEEYTVTFNWAAAQQLTFNTSTFDTLTVSLGSQSFTTSQVNLPEHGFSGWMSQSFTFTATGPSEVLSFFASGGPPGAPPFAMLDSVSMMAVPEPSTWAMMLAGFGGLGYAGFPLEPPQGRRDRLTACAQPNTVGPPSGGLVALRPSALAAWRATS